jgi:hypothetical protein
MCRGEARVRFGIAAAPLRDWDVRGRSRRSAKPCTVPCEKPCDWSKELVRVYDALSRIPLVVMPFKPNVTCLVWEFRLDWT